MRYNFEKYGQYKNDIFNKMAIDFKKGKRLLDVGCGDGTDAEIFIQEFGLDVYGIDIYQHQNIKNIKNLKFKKAGICKIPFEDNSFDYVFSHDVLHHIDEKNQSYENHINGLKEVKRVCKSDGQIMILEANRYNPLFYPHMVLMKGHNHFSQKYFLKIISNVFKNVEFRFFEAHFYPPKLLKIFKIFEFFMERITLLAPLRAYNLTIIKNDKFKKNNRENNI